MRFRRWRGAFESAPKIVTSDISMPTTQTAPATHGGKRHHWIVRVTHWVNVVALTLMVATGLRIFNAYPAFARKGEAGGEPGDPAAGDLDAPNHCAHPSGPARRQTV